MGNFASYASLTDLKNALPGSGSADDAALLQELETVSRWIEGRCGRHFSVRSETRYFTASHPNSLLIDDLLSVPTLQTDEDGDLDYDVTWAVTDYILHPRNHYPKTKILVHPNGDYLFLLGIPDGVKITGLWGYGDGESATPYEPSGCTITVANGTATTVTPSDQSLLQVGQTILCGTEQMYIRSLTDGGVGADSGTVFRGVNGTTAAAQAGAAASIYRYPDRIRKACLLRAAQLWMLKQGPMGTIGGGDMTVQAPAPYAVILDLISDYRLIEAG